MVDNYRKLQPLRNRHIFVRHVSNRDARMIDKLQEVQYSKLDWIF